MKSLESLQLQQPTPVVVQVADHVRDLVSSGRLGSGTKLPSTQELARMWRSDVKTVHNALTVLVKEGLIVRYPKRGTFVRQREAKLSCVGIYYVESTWTKQASDFYRMVHAALKEDLDRLGVQTQVWVDPRPLAAQDREWPELRRAAEHREIQGLIVLQGGWAHTRWLNKLPIPSAHITTAGIPNKVNTDYQQLAELSLCSLARQGCRSVGLICPVPAALSNPDGSRSVFDEFLERFIDLASDLGLTVRNEWMRTPGAEQRTRGDLSRAASQEHYGYEEFLKLWSQPQRPAGLVIHPDTVAQGVILALREQQVRVPAELRLVITKNENIPLLCPMPATLLVSSERAFARALIAQVQKQFRGEACQPVMVPFRLLAHPAA